MILHLTDPKDQAEMADRITSGATMHRPEVLLGELRQFQVRLPLELVAMLRSFPWTIDLHYKTGRTPTGEAIGFLRTARMVREWVREQMP